MDFPLEQRLADGKACLAAALLYLDMGWSVLPLCPPDHLGLGSLNPKHSQGCASPGKRPWILWKKYQTELPTVKVIRDAWKKVPTSNLGLALGPVSGLVRVDADGPNGEAALARMSGGDLPPTLEFRSGRPDGTGRGLLYATISGVPLRTTFKREDELVGELRFQAQGAQTVLPPSRHWQGPLYTWLPGHSPGEIQAAPMPDWVIAALQEKVPGSSAAPGSTRRTQAEWDELFDGVEEGRRDVGMTAVVGRLLAALRDLDRDSLHSVRRSVEAINAQNDPPMDETQLAKVFMSILRSEKARRESASLSQLDRKVAEQILLSQQTASGSTNGNGHAHTPSTNGEASTLPEWHLIRVHTSPVTFRLRSPFWSSCSRLKDGYILLSAAELLDWSARTGIRRACLQQTGILPPHFKGWAAAGGMLEQLFGFAQDLESSPESQRSLYVLGFVYRYLADARPLNYEDDGTPKKVLAGKPTRLEDQAIIFKLAHLKHTIRETKEDFTHSELMHLLEENAFAPRWFQDTRWWQITEPGIASLGALTREGGATAPQIQKVKCGAENPIQ